MADNGVRFVRINGRVVPIKGKSAKKIGSKTQEKAPKAEVHFKFKQYDRDTATRAKEGLRDGAQAGGILGGIVGAQFGLRGIAAGAAIGATGVGAIHSGLSAAFGSRKGVAFQTQLVKKKKVR